MKTLHVWPKRPEICDGEVRLHAVFEGFDSGNKTIEIAVQQSALHHMPSRSDHFALAALFPAMRAFDATRFGSFGGLRYIVKYDGKQMRFPKNRSHQSNARAIYSLFLVALILPRL